ncbi:MAG: Na+/H+ antiporter NhaC family protein, partial [Treponema sp.]|nr:Na+/H+ antiporter NhaC family protein [Treponema sp.]
LSSTGAGCPHLEHVATQMPYAIFVAFCSFVGFVVAGITMNLVVSWIAFIAVLALGIVFLPKMTRKA